MHSASVRRVLRDGEVREAKEASGHRPVSTQASRSRTPLGCDRESLGVQGTGAVVPAGQGLGSSRGLTMLMEGGGRWRTVWASRLFVATRTVAAKRGMELGRMRLLGGFSALSSAPTGEKLNWAPGEGESEGEEMTR